MKAVIETFKDIPDYEGLYQVSDYGAVRSLNYNGTGKVKFMKNHKTPNGYEQIKLFYDGKPKTFKVHRLVWESFVGPIPDGMEIDHVNTIRDDNRLDNLRVVTRKGNMANQITTARHQEATREANQHLAQNPKWIEAHREGTRKSHNKPILQLDKTTGETIKRWECAADVERELGINNSSISKCCLGKLNSAGGYRWSFA